MTHSCPYNSKYQFEICSKTVCPYHTSRLTDSFNISEESNCIKIDAPEIVATLADDSLSSLDRTGYAKVNHRRIRRDIEETLALSKSIITVFKEVPEHKFCKDCGAPVAQCDSNNCGARKAWIEKAKSVLKISNRNPILYANIWKLLAANKLYLNNAVLERHGRALLPRA